MEVKHFADLAQRDGLHPPSLGMLKPDAEHFNILAIQPEGHIRVQETSIGNSNSTLAGSQLAALITLGLDQGVDLLVAPEYFCPWDSLLSAIESGKVPPEGQLWALGCESAQLEELRTYRARLETAGFKVYEAARISNGGTFVDPMCYIFQTRNTSGTLQKVALIQFKTAFSGDGGEHYERDRLILGQDIFVISRPEQPSISISALICSDVLGLSERVRNVIANDGVILHLQLNEKPRHANYALYRSELYATNRRVAVFTLNWAEKIRFTGTCTQQWQNESFSAYYWRSSDFERTEDERFNSNHQHGAYWHYWATPQVDVCVFNYRPGAFLFRSTKVDQQLGSLQQRGHTGPQARSFYEWDTANNRWGIAPSVDAGFTAQLLRIAHANCSFLTGLPPLSVEQLVALSTGHARKSSWFKLRRLPLARLESEEISYRFSFAQDFHPRARDHRDSLLSALGKLVKILQEETFPKHIEDLHNNYVLKIDPAKPWFNLYSTGDGAPATAVFIGEAPDREQAFNDIKHALDTEPEVAKRGDSRRLVLWYYDHNGTPQTVPIAPPKIDDFTEHGADIGRQIT